MKRQQQKIKDTRNASGEERISISLRYLTKDDNYLLERFRYDRQKWIDVLAAFYNYIARITSLSWLGFSALRKNAGGYEMLPARSLKKSVLGSCDEAPEKYYSCRFGNSDSYRMIGFKKASDPVFYITGFDLDYSAYNHGE